jgi:uncharacterized membrane protein YbjE (DUF340 family)
MGHLLSLGIIIAFLLAGLLLGRINRISRSSWVQYCVDAALYLLLFFMGFRLGRNEDIVEQLGQIGVLSLAFTAATVAGTVLVLFLIYGLARKRKGSLHRPADGNSGTETENPRPKARFARHIQEPAKLFAVVILGFFAGRFVPLFPAFTAEKTTTWFVYFLLFFIGIQLNNSTMSLKEALVHPETLLLPLGTVIGSLAGGILVGVLFRLSIWKTMSVAAGFGWYSLSGVIISDLGDQVLGSAAFISNILRESVALLTIPFFGASRFPRIGIGIAGATSMDVTLPLIRKSCGIHTVPLAVSHGALLSVLVPILVPLFFHLG